MTAKRSVVVDSCVRAFLHVTLCEQNRRTVLRAGKVQERVINAYQKVIRVPFKPSGEWRFADELNNLVAHQLPELLR